MPKIIIDYKYELWTGVKAHCPICNRTFTGWYCPTCGLPKKNSKYAPHKYGGLHNCGHYHFRPEFTSFEKFQLCCDCYAANPSDAKYCKNCGKKITSWLSKDAHGWVDLGLSVLWSTETMEGLYFWGDCSELNHSTDISCFEKNRINKKNYLGDVDSVGYDIATQKWGERWRTPTKEEFEELMIKCKWEKCIDPKSDQHALKVIGPNGKSIILPVTGYAGCNQKPKIERNSLSGLLGIPTVPISPESIYSTCRFWTSSEDETNPERAFVFSYNGYGSFTKTLTAKEKKEIEIENARYARKSESNLNFYLDSWLNPEEMMRKQRQERQKEEEEREILRAMGDDTQERADNIKKDLERRRKLWLDTPVKFEYNYKLRNTLRPLRKHSGYAIRPVADKKWQGKL